MAARARGRNLLRSADLGEQSARELTCLDSSNTGRPLRDFRALDLARVIMAQGPRM